MDIEDTLRRFRPIGPPADLHDRVMAAAAVPAVSPARDRWIDWLWPAGAAAACVLFSVLAMHERRQARTDPSTVDRIKSSLVRRLTEEFAGDELLATHVVNVEFVEDTAVIENTPDE